MYADTFQSSTLKLSEKTESPRELIQLPLSDGQVQRTYLVKNGESTASAYFEIDGKKMRYVSGKSTHTPLSDVGKEEAATLAKHLVKCFPKDAEIVIVSSTALRTRQTAQILFHTLSLTHSNVTLAKETYPGLDERSLGSWEGKLRDDAFMEAESSWKALSAAEKFIAPQVTGGESYAEVVTRALRALNQIKERYGKETVIAVTSFNTLSAVAIHLNNLTHKLSTIPGSHFPDLELKDRNLLLFETIQNLNMKKS